MGESDGPNTDDIVWESLRSSHHKVDTLEIEVQKLKLSIAMAIVLMFGIALLRFTTSRRDKKK